MALINGVSHDINDLTAHDLGQLIRKAWIGSAEQEVSVKFSEKEEVALAFDGINSLSLPSRYSLEDQLPTQTIGQTIAHGIREACEEHGNPCLINFEYEDRIFKLSGTIIT